jgi:hypothetical protein
MLFLNMVCLAVALACPSPEQLERACSTWTISEQLKCSVVTSSSSLTVLTSASFFRRLTADEQVRRQLELGSAAKQTTTSHSMKTRPLAPEISR